MSTEKPEGEKVDRDQKWKVKSSSLLRTNH